MALTNALYKMSRLTNVTSTHGNEGEGKCEAQNTDRMQIVLNDVSSAMHEQIQVFLKGDARCPYPFDQMNINSLISQMNPTLWKTICSITQSVSEHSVLMCVGADNEAKYAQRVASAMDVSISPIKECTVGR